MHDRIINKNSTTKNVKNYLAQQSMTMHVKVGYISDKIIVKSTKKYFARKQNRLSHRQKKMLLEKKL